jgi:hypothetical protein
VEWEGGPSSGGEGARYQFTLKRECGAWDFSSFPLSCRRCCVVDKGRAGDTDVLFVLFLDAED